MESADCPAHLKLSTFGCLILNRLNHWLEWTGRKRSWDGATLVTSRPAERAGVEWVGASAPAGQGRLCLRLVVALSWNASALLCHCRALPAFHMLQLISHSIIAIRMAHRTGPGCGTQKTAHAVAQVGSLHSS